MPRGERPTSVHDAPDWEANPNPALAEYSQKQNEKFGKLRDSKGEVVLGNDVDLSEQEDAPEEGEWGGKTQERHEVSERTESQMENITIETLEADKEALMEGAIDMSMNASTRLWNTVSKNANKLFGAFTGIFKYGKEGYDSLIEDDKANSGGVHYENVGEPGKGEYVVSRTPGRLESTVGAIKDAVGASLFGAMGILDKPSEIMERRRQNKELEKAYAQAEEDYQDTVDYSPEGIRRQEAARVAAEYEALYTEVDARSQITNFITNFAEKGVWGNAKDAIPGLASFLWGGTKDMGLEALAGAFKLPGAMKAELKRWADEQGHERTFDAIDAFDDKLEKVASFFHEMFTRGEVLEQERKDRIARAKTNRHSAIIANYLKNPKQATEALRANPEARQEFGDAQDALEQLESIVAEARKDLPDAAEKAEAQKAA